MVTLKPLKFWYSDKTNESYVLKIELERNDNNTHLKVGAMSNKETLHTICIKFILYGRKRYKNKVWRV
jgi:hypothetical protein